MKKWNYEDVKEYIETNSNCKLISNKYINIKEKLNLQCECGENFEVTFDLFYHKNKRTCNQCSKNRVYNAQVLSYKEVKNFIEVESNSNCKLISENYINCNTKLIIKCFCGQIFETSFIKFKTRNKRQCNECGNYNKNKDRVKTHEQFLIDIHEKGIDKEYKILGQYISALQPIMIQHLKCGHIWSPIASSVLRNHGCPQCFGSNLKTTEFFKKEVFDLVGDEFILLDEYVNNTTKIRFKHITCGNEFLMTPREFLRGNRCFKCKMSKGEKSISKILTDLNIEFIEQYRFDDCKYKYTLPFDFYLPDYNVCVEFHGKQHYNPINFFGGNEGFQVTQLRDKIKEEYCIKNNIQLLIIPYWNIKNINIILKQYFIDFKIFNTKDIHNPFMIFIDENDTIESVNNVEYIISKNIFKNLIRKLTIQSCN